MYILFKSSYKISLKWVVDILPLNCKNRFELIEGMYVNSRFFFHKSNFPKSIGYFLTRKKTVLTKEINDSVLEFWPLHSIFFLSKCLNNFFVAIFSAGMKPPNNAASTTNNSTKVGNPSNVKNNSTRSHHFTVNRRLIPLKLTLFFFSASAFSILPYLTIHMSDIGITVEHIGK